MALLPLLQRDDSHTAKAAQQISAPRFRFEAVTAKKL
ncbi:hypothetical protein BH23CYA1_BH23CYA1_10860 [soil metagenome]